MAFLKTFWELDRCSLLFYKRLINWERFKEFARRADATQSIIELGVGGNTRERPGLVSRLRCNILLQLSEPNKVAKRPLGVVMRPVDRGQVNLPVH